mmetsp:Transcript_17354/g.28863  ORF Transcript_17354/g.28863 Transcript_17354/m.28863 type:complete len:95 (-) Transcript_17354:263-547(-)
MSMSQSVVKGGYWYRKFWYAGTQCVENYHYPSDELYDTTFSIWLWFQSKLHKNAKRIKGAIVSGLDCPSVSDNMRFNPSVPVVYDQVDCGIARQ